MPDIAGATSGASSGAAAGATIGSAVPGIGTAAGAVVGGVAGFLGGLFGGGSEESGYQLPLVFEYEIMNAAEANLQGISQDLNRATQTYNLYDQRLKTLEGVMNATIPGKDALEMLRDNSLNIAMHLGQDAQSLIDNGFLNEDDIADLESLGALEGQGFSDPVLENQITSERAKLEQDLRRQGASPATRAQALSQFDRSAEESRFTRAEELRTGKFQRITGKVQLRQGLKESNLQRTLSGYGAVGNEINQARVGVGAAADLSGARYNASNAYTDIRQKLRTERLGTFESLGKFKFSNKAEQLAIEGGVGPRAGKMIDTNTGVYAPNATENRNNYFARQQSNQERLDRLRQAQFFNTRTLRTSGY